MSGNHRLVNAFGRNGYTVMWIRGRFERRLETHSRRRGARPLYEPVIHECDGHCILAHSPGFVP